MVALALLLLAMEETPLHLVCLGAGSANRIRSEYGSAYDNHGNAVWAQSVGGQAVPFDDQINIDLNEDGSGRIRMPRAMLPDIHGGKDGWFKVADVKRSDQEITGKVLFNIVNKPRLRIDRMTGNINISGQSGDYTGSCQPYDPATVQRKF